MPTYAYRCRRCGHEFDVVQRITDPARARCPACRGSAERVITGGGGFLLRGEGFYATDYRSESYRRAAKSESDAAGGAKPAAGAPSSGGEAGAGEAKAAKGGGVEAGAAREPAGEGGKARGPAGGGSSGAKGEGRGGSGRKRRPGPGRDKS